MTAELDRLLAFERTRLRVGEPDEVSDADWFAEKVSERQPGCSRGPNEPDDACAVFAQEAEQRIQRYAEKIASLERQLSGQPIPMMLYCPECGLQHIDAPTLLWSNPPHRSHLCSGCETIWRPADVPTEGVASIQTRGVDDSPVRVSSTLRLPLAEIAAALDQLVPFHRSISRLAGELRRHIAPAG